MKKKEAIFFSAVYILGIIWTTTYRAYNWDITVCPVKLLFGVPCPGCGMTRAAGMVLSGNIAEGIQMNPNVILVTIIAVAAPFVLAANIFYGKDYTKTIDRWLGKKPAMACFVVFETIIWICNIARHI